MGSWNNTCGLSNLPICYDDKVYIFPIKEVDQSRDRSFCYTSALYEPSFVGFEADYDTYGRGENCQGASLKALMAAISKSLVEKDVGENQYCDIEVRRYGFDVDTFFETVHENRLFVKNYFGNEEAVFFTMIRKDIADRLWSEWKWETFSDKEIPGADIKKEDWHGDNYARYSNVTYELLSESIPDFLKKIQESVEADEICFNRIERIDHYLAKLFERGGDRRWNLIPISHLLEELVKQGKMEYATLLVRDFLMGHMINSFMSSVRRVWLPVMHQGSQSEEWKEYKLLSRLCEDAIRRVESENEEWEE